MSNTVAEGRVDPQPISMNQNPNLPPPTPSVAETIFSFTPSVGVGRRFEFPSSIKPPFASSSPVPSPAVETLSSEGPVTKKGPAFPPTSSYLRVQLFHHSEAGDLLLHLPFEEPLYDHRLLFEKNRKQQQQQLLLLKVVEDTDHDPNYRHRVEDQMMLQKRRQQQLLLLLLLLIQYSNYEEE